VDRIEQVFVSSTYLDLKEERQAVIQTLLQADCMPAGMELFPASDDDRWTLIQRVIDRSDYYVVVIGARYGSVDPQTSVSYTEMEYDCAVSVDIPVMGYVHEDPNQLTIGQTDKSDAAFARMLSFRGKVQERMCKGYRSADDLAGKVALSILHIRRSHPATGWVRADEAFTPEKSQELAELRARVLELEAELVHVSVSPLAGTEALEQGDDPVDVRVILNYWTDKLLEQRQENERHFGISPERISPIRATYTWRTTWNRILAVVGPEMLDEASETDLFAKLAVSAAPSFKSSGKGQPDYRRLDSGSLTVEGQDIVRIQLRALGLIEPSRKKHGVTDRNVYWSLSPLGETQLLKLRARRRVDSEVMVQRPARQTTEP
jgi:hypothetical protein